MSDESKKRRLDRIKEMWIEHLDEIARRMDETLKRQGKQKRPDKRNKRKATRKGANWKCTP